MGCDWDSLHQSQWALINSRELSIGIPTLILLLRGLNLLWRRSSCPCFTHDVEPKEGKTWRGQVHGWEHGHRLHDQERALPLHNFGFWSTSGHSSGHLSFIFFSNPGPVSVFSVVGQWLMLRLELCDWLTDLWRWREEPLHSLREVAWPEERLCLFGRDSMTWGEIAWNGKRFAGLQRGCHLCERGCERVVAWLQLYWTFSHSSNPDFFHFYVRSKQATPTGCFTITVKSNFSSFMTFFDILDLSYVSFVYNWVGHLCFQPRIKWNN